MTLVPIDWQDEEILRQIDLLSFGLNLLGDPKKLQLRLVIELVATAALAVLDVVFVRRVKDLANDKHLFIDNESDLRRQVEEAKGRRGLDSLYRLSYVFWGPSGHRNLGK
jgi:hypothetical protein